MNTALLDIQAVRRHFRFPAAGRVVLRIRSALVVVGP